MAAITTGSTGAPAHNTVAKSSEVSETENRDVDQLQGMLTQAHPTIKIGQLGYHLLPAIRRRRRVPNLDHQPPDAIREVQILGLYPVEEQARSRPAADTMTMGATAVVRISTL